MSYLSLTLLLMMHIPSAPANVLVLPRYLGTCRVGTLAAPGDPGYGPYSADYYAPQFSYTYGASVHLTFAAYASLDDTPPVIASYQVLASDFSPLEGQHYSVVATGCQQDQSGPPPTTSMFTYSADWSAPSRNGVYYLAVSFAYADGTLVDYFANITVRATPQIITAGSVHWETTLSGIGYQQSNAAYNLFSTAATDLVTARTSFYFDANPAATCAAASCTPGSDATAFIQGGMDNNLEGSNVFLLDTPPHLPLYKDGWNRQAHSFAFSQNLGGVTVNDTGTVSVERGRYTFGGHSYRYHVEIDEPFALRQGGTTFVHVGSYVLDNGITGPIGWQGSADNLGEGQGVRFYVNPSAPTAPASAITTTAAVAAVTLSGYDLSPSGAVELPNGGTMSWQYAVHLSAAHCPSTTAHSTCTIGAELAGSPHHTTNATDTWTSLPAGTTGGSTCYWPQVRVTYVVRGSLHLTSDLVPSGINAGDYDNIFCLAQAVTPSTDTPTPTPPTTATLLASTTAATTVPPAGTPSSTVPPTARSTAFPTSTPTVIATMTVTPLPPTATPTAAHAVLLLAQTVVPYAWVRTYQSEDPTASDRLYASTWQHNRDPATFYWPIGRALHLLPAVDENPAEDRLLVTDQGNGATTMLYPQVMTATAYTLLDAGALSSTHCWPSGRDAQSLVYAHDPRYPAEVDPFSPRIALVWASAILAGTLPTTTVRCDPTSLVTSGAPGPATLSYRIEEQLTFAARFADPVPPVGGASDCTAQLAPLPVATPFSAEARVPAPLPAFTDAQAPPGSCSGGDVGLPAVRDALEHWSAKLHLADPHGTITALGYTVSGTLVRLTIAVTRTVALHYHLLVSREVLP